MVSEGWVETLASARACLRTTGGIVNGREGRSSVLLCCTCIADSPEYLESRDGLPLRAKREMERKGVESEALCDMEAV